MTNIFVYWQNKEGTTTPEYIELCRETIYKHNSNCNITVIDNKNLHHYIDIPPSLFKINSIAQMADFIRIALIYEHGGIWLDSDCIVIKSLAPVISMLHTNNYVGYLNKTNKIANGFIAANKKSELISEIYEHLLFKLQEKKDFKWTELGQQAITYCYKKLKNKKNIHIYDMSYFSPIDWRDAGIFFEDIEPSDIIPQNSLCVMLFNEEFSRKKYSLSQQSRNDILNQNNLLGRLFCSNIA